MARRKIGIYYTASDTWIGGKYYFDAIIDVLKKDADNEIVFLNPFKRNFFLKVAGKVFGKKSSVYVAKYNKKLNSLKLDVVFPYRVCSWTGKRKVFWIPDFQENYYPEFFSIDDICSRLTNQAKIAYSNDWLCLSSQSAKKDFERLFPKYTCNVFVLPFISSLYGHNMRVVNNVSEKYNINEPFFICSNQLWKHKNHVVIIKAISELKKNGKHILCLFTGKESDYRNPDYPEYLKKMVKEYDLESEIRFLGFIPREEQIELMKKSLAVIQPSMFEGWNTSVEDAKYLGKLVIASSIAVHKEQLGGKGLFFNVENYLGLAKILMEISSLELISIDYNYIKQVEEYKHNVKTIFYGS